MLSGGHSGSCASEKEMELVGGVNGWACSLSVFEVFNIEAANPEPKMIEARVRSPSLSPSPSLSAWLFKRKTRAQRVENVESNFIKLWKIEERNLLSTN